MLTRALHFLHPAAMAKTINPLEITVLELQNGLSNGDYDSVQVVQVHLDQINKHNERLRGVIQTAPTEILFAAARALDQELLVKDNINTHPSLGMGTTGGSFALLHAKPNANAAVVENLLEAGAIIIGKANLSELACFKGDKLWCGWSAIGGQGQSPYVEGGLDPKDNFGGHSNPGGSSSGSAISVAAGFAPISVGTETSGSLSMPANRAALFTMKSTLGLIPSEGIMPACSYLDSAGPMAKTALDFAYLLQAMIGKGSKDYAAAATARWDGIRIGAVDSVDWPMSTSQAAYEEAFVTQQRGEIGAVYEKLKELGVVIKHPVSLIGIKEFDADGPNPMGGLMLNNIQQNIDDYLADLEISPVRTMKEIVEFNRRYSLVELPPDYPSQAYLESALEAKGWTKEESEAAIQKMHGIARERGVDHTLRENDINVIIGPCDSRLDAIVTGSGYPCVTLPLSYYKRNGRPFGLIAIATAGEEALLVQLMSAWEATFPKRQSPKL
ncbi:amidase signature enzyme [Mollisia scopiformis]|uniref:Amidase signature enzyme n=1 Tax=Mollisia scopiformis TaxID=149040 RepID=A0A194X3D9_MOLSC|nr:amidase signature enzyme [Mollisia scopiformis]KUJ14715.1 amidase signature enzyme [Mollisia scopiformis]